MTRMLDLVADTRRKVYGSMSDQLNFLAVETQLGDTELFMSMDLGAIQPGMVLSSGLNVYYVIGTDPAQKKVTVYPNYDNSLNNALPIGSPVMIRPRVTDWHLFNELNNVIVQMSSRTCGLYRQSHWMTKADNNWNTFVIPPEAQDMMAQPRVFWQSYGYSDEVWIEVNPLSVKWQPGESVVRLTTGFGYGRDVRFEYTAPFSKALFLTSDVEADCGLAPTMTDIPPLGAAVALLQSTESRRQNVHAQGDTRRAAEVVAGGNTAAAREMQRMFNDRVDDEYIRLTNRNPITQSI